MYKNVAHLPTFVTSYADERIYRITYNCFSVPVPISFYVSKLIWDPQLYSRNEFSLDGNVTSFITDYTKEQSDVNIDASSLT